MNLAATELDCCVSPSQSLPVGWFSSWKGDKDYFEEQQQKENLKIKHLEIGGSKVNFFARCSNYLNVSVPESKFLVYLI